MRRIGEENRATVFRAAALNLNWHTWDGHVASAPRCRPRKSPAARGSLLSRRDSMVPQSVRAAGPEDGAAALGFLSRPSSRWPFCPNTISG